MAHAPASVSDIGQFLAQMLDRWRDDGDEIGLSQAPLRGGVDQITAGARMEHRGVDRAQAPFRRRETRLQQRNHVIGRMFIGRRRQPGDLALQRRERVLKKLRPFRQIGVDGAVALVGFPHGRDRPPDQAERHAGLEKNEARSDADEIGLRRVGQNLLVRDKGLAERDGEGARAFERAKMGTLGDGHARLPAANQRHHGRLSPRHGEHGAENMAVAEVGHPGQFARNDIAALDPFAGQAKSFDPGEGFHRIGQARSAEQATGRHLGKQSRLQRLIVAVVEIPGAGALAPNHERRREAGGSDLCHAVDRVEQSAFARRIGADMGLVEASLAKTPQQRLGIQPIAVDLADNWVQVARHQRPQPGPVPDVLRCLFGKGHESAPSADEADLDRYGPDERVGDGRPFESVRHQRVEALARRVCVEAHLGAHMGEADRLGFRKVARAPDGRDVDVALQLELERRNGDSLRDGVGVDADRQAGAERRQRGLGGIRRRVVAQQRRRLVDDIGGQVADVVGVAEAAFRDRAALDSLDDLGIGLAGGGKAGEALLVDRGEAAGQSRLQFGHGVFSLSESEETNRKVCLQRAGRRRVRDAVKKLDIQLDIQLDMQLDKTLDKRPENKPAERILDAAARLFCREGIHATGIDRILHEAGAAKMTLYNQFGSKEQLVQVVLRRESAAWRAWFSGALAEAGRTPREKLEAVFVVLRQWFERGDYLGCSIMNAIAEYPKGDPTIRALAGEHKAGVAAILRELIDQAGCERPDELLAELFVLVDGAIIAALISGDARAANAAGRLGRLTIAAHLPAK